ncbi:two-component sensor histidine kinase [Tenacibaculum sp. SZ-18]|uniref:sensor histidine kinase n=1 Tax=Tenacibaculum sp. SZ-18 TaxID=754423 RepID=UPI000C2D0EB5|nr:ATP-binding protein [Tenacibaculum sp. SZ-18]AUC15243.1 two-component sensor histidine kinase [Tenacibaculum sp. SZ-18]
MNSLLKRQVRKYLPKHLQQNEDLQRFLEAVDSSYDNLEDQVLMQQRATALSSEELYELNEKLRDESKAQKEVIEKLQSVMYTLRSHESGKNSSFESSNSLKLVDFIDHQTKEIIKINKQKDLLLRNLEDQNQELNDYAHIVSHDLVTPIQNIETLVHLLEDDYSPVLDDRGKNKLKLISDNVHRIEILLNGIRDYSSIDKERITKSDLDLNKLIHDTLQEMKLCRSIQVKIIGKLPNLKAEKHSFKHLFSNLIENAVKFNDKVHKKVQIGFHECEESWRFYIKDNGKGIDEPYLKKVFKAFFKLQNDPKSAGLGLSIVKKVINLHEGKVWAESQINKGSTFFFELKK